MAVNSISVEPVTTRAQLRQFIMFPFRLYRPYPHWVPPLIADRFKHFDPKRNPFYEYATVQLFLAKRAGKVVGTIAAIDNPKHEQVWHEKMGFWGEFEVINDYDVAAALFDAARTWLTGRGQPVMRGPFNMNINDETGLLIDGYDGPPVLMMTYNPPYYQDLIERYGFIKAKDLNAYKLELDMLGPNLENMPKQIAGAAAIAESRYHIKMRHISKEHLDEDVELVKPIYREAWAKNWGALPMSDAEFAALVENLKAICDFDLTYLAFIDDKPIGVFLALPDFCQVALHLGGRLLPFGWINYLRYKPKINGARVMIMGVLAEHRVKGVESLFYREGFKMAAQKGIKWAEFSWILEDNYFVMRGIERIGWQDLPHIPYLRSSHVDIVTRPIKLVADTASDLGEREAAELGIELVPLSVAVGKASYPEDTLTHDDFWRLAEGQVVSTSQPPVGAFTSVFKRWVDEGHQVLCVTISGLMSGTFRSAEQAALEFAPHITLHDSLAISRATAVQLDTASYLVRQGADIPTILEAMNSVRDRTHVLLLLDTLDQLRLGGRAAAFIPLLERLSSAFQIKPMITLMNGELKFAHVSHSFRKGLDLLLREITRFKPADQVAVVHTRRPELAGTFANKLAAGLGFERSRISICEAGAVMSAHGGEGLIAVVVVSTA